MTLDLRAQALAWAAEGRPAVVVSVLQARGSVPREAGTRMLVSARAVAGTRPHRDGSASSGQTR